jgi:hypothetical protein
MITGEL